MLWRPALKMLFIKPERKTAAESQAAVHFKTSDARPERPLKKSAAPEKLI